MGRVIYSLPQQLYRPEQVGDNEEAAARAVGKSLWDLMQEAGAAAFECLQHDFEEARSVTVLCGPGNNGGDGYIVAQLAKEAGYAVNLFASKEPGTDDARKAAKLWQQAGGDTRPLNQWQPGQCQPGIEDVIVDALLGTGLNSEVRGEIATVIDKVNACSTPVLAIDIPTGLSADTGCVLGCAIEAESTVTMIGVKRGMLTGKAPDYVGRIRFAPLGVRDAFSKLTEPVAIHLDKSHLLNWLPRRKRCVHKGSFGHVLIIGGQAGMAGATRMAGTAAIRAGAGKVSVICEPGQEAIAGQQPELMVRGLNPDSELADQLIDQASVIAIGPGLGQSDWGFGWWTRILNTDKPLVMDADALNFLSRERVSRDNWILTPHPGEAARLLATDTSTIESNRWQAAEQLATTYGGVVVLKGSGTLVTELAPKQQTFVNTTGTPAMASAGMGDVLTGIIAGIVAQQFKLTLQEAAGLGVLVHGGAAETAAAGRTRGLIATDVLQSLTKWMNPS